MGQVVGYIQDLQKAVSNESERQLGAQARDLAAHIRHRTMQGYAATGKRFVPYAPSTAIRKHRSSPVTMRESWYMIDSLQERKISSRQWVVSTMGVRNRRVAAWQQFGVPQRNLPERRWFGATLVFARQMGMKYNRAIELATPRNRTMKFTATIKL